MEYGRNVKNKHSNHKPYYNNPKNTVIIYVKKEVDVKKDDNFE